MPQAANGCRPLPIVGIAPSALRRLDKVLWIGAAGCGWSKCKSHERLDRRAVQARRLRVLRAQPSRDPVSAVAALHRGQARASKYESGAQFTWVPRKRRM